MLLQADAGGVFVVREVQGNVVGEQVVVAAPALHGHAQRGCGEAGAHQHAVAAPGQAAAKPAQGFVIQLAHGGLAQPLHLQGGHAAIGFELAWRDLCLAQSVARVQPALRVR